LLPLVSQDARMVGTQSAGEGTEVTSPAQATSTGASSRQS
jgi:hypothetical protein